MRADGHVEASLIADAEGMTGWRVSNAEWTEHLSTLYAVTADLAHGDPDAEAMPLLGRSVEIVLALWKAQKKAESNALLRMYRRQLSSGD